MTSIHKLNTRIQFIENRVQHFIHYKHKLPKERCKGFVTFASSFRNHVISFLLHNTPSCPPNNRDIMKELAHIWNQLTDEEQSHWKLLS